MRRAPEQPRGCPSAMAPPLTLTRSMSGWSSRSHASTTEAKASLISKRSIRSIVSPAFLSTRWVAGMGPVSMMVGSTPASDVGDLRGIAGGHHAVGLEGRRERCELLPVHGHPHPLVHLEDAAIGQRDWSDLPLEASLGDGASRLLVTLAGELVELLALEPPLLGEHLGRDALGHDLVESLEPWRQRAFAGTVGVGAHGHAAHALHPACDDAVVLAGHHAHGREVGRLLPGPAHAVEGGAANVQREAADEGGIARDVQSLLAELIDAADDHVLHLGGIDARARHQRLQRLGEEVVGTNGGELAVALADGCASRPHDHCVVHVLPPLAMCGPSIQSGAAALDLITELAERADLPRGHLPAHRALVQYGRLRVLEGAARLLQESEEEVVLGPWRGFLEPVEDLLVGDGSGALGEGTFLDDVVDAAQEGVGGSLPLGESVQWLDPARELGMRGVEGGRLARQRIHLPVEHVAEEHGRLVVQVVPSGDHAIAVLHRRPVHQVAFAEAAGGAGRPTRRLLHLRDRGAHALGHRLHDQLLPAGSREGFALGLGFDGVVEDAEVEIQTGRGIAGLDQDIPQGEGVLPAGDGYQHGLVEGDHPMLADGLGDLLAEELQEVRRAEGRVVTRQLDDRARPALAALHWALPPDITGRTSSSSPSPTTSSAVRRSLPRITSTVPGRMSSSRSTSLTRLRPGRSTSRLGLRSLIFTPSGILAPP